ncbi:DUF1329 domain-containing protein [Variovorax paradoxus]|uniref:DUF1329 domain-containing protein n=1 Tax=Variovorax paradoxus TaxID=34073 RepID=A0A5Q0M9R8_VARPD|nr:DUF1329 domain-containing protein [Variovorax paradoxus]QFZ85172.1 DUF1329 domain-containing protein [Variovorax paradoxus]
MKSSSIFTAALLCFAQLGQGAIAAVSAEEAAKLKSTLMPLGGERAGNKAGTIPAWDGGYTKPSPGWKSGQPRPDPFAGEKPLFSITAKNVDEYANALSEVSKALFKRYPGYRIDVYPSHRTAAAPQWVYDNTFKNAIRAMTTEGGNSLEGAHGGIPFPIPKDGYEVLWNHRMSWVGEETFFPFSGWIVTADGKRVLATKAEEWSTYPVYYKEGSPDSFQGVFLKTKLTTLEPASKAGEGVLGWQVTQMERTGYWQYLVGQRRVRRSPSLAYDTPNFIVSGIGLMDEAFSLYGPIDRHEIKLVGKREMIVPYNNNKAALAKSEDLIQPNFLNPDLVRWELHRVWEVEATLKPGKRHVMPKRRYYVDEDSWSILQWDGWDAQGALWRGGYALTLLAPDIPALVGNVVNWGGYNIQTGEYYMSVSTNDARIQYQVLPRKSESFYTPEALGSDGAR